MIYLGVPVTIVVLALLLLGYLRRRAQRADYTAGLDAEHMRRIEEDGFLVYEEDEPLDPEEIERAETEFWTEERWDEGEEW